MAEENPELKGLRINQKALTDSIASLSSLPDAHDRQATIDEERGRLKQVEARITELVPPAPAVPAKTQLTS